MPKPQREVEIEEDDLDPQIDDNANKQVVDEDDAARKSREAVFGKDEDDFDEPQEDSRLAYDEDTGDVRDDRPSRRQRRNRARRERRNQDAAIIEASNERIARLEAAIENMSRAQLGLHAGGVDSQIAETRGHIAQIGDVIAKAVSEGDGVKVARAMALRDEANQRLMQLSIERGRIEQVATQRPQQVEQQTPRPTVDPDAARYSEIFMDRHPWFDPEDNSDEDSQIVKAIDDKLVNDGFKPNTARYWKELEKRVAARGLGKDRDDMEDDYGADDDGYDDRRRPARRDPDGRGGLPGRSQRGGTGARREAAYDERRLPPLARDTLDQLGLLDKNGLSKEQLAERENYIQTWRKGLKAADEAKRNR